MTKNCTECKSEIPFIARICPQCGKKVIYYCQHSLEGVNPARNNTLDRTTRGIASGGQNAEGISRSIRIDQGGRIKPNEMPGISGALTMVLVPRYMSNCFELKDFRSNPDLGSLPLNGALKNATTPVFDGLFFNVICENHLQRIGINRVGELLFSEKQYTTSPVSTRVPAPLLITRDLNRYLLFTANGMLYVLDISAFRNESPIYQLKLSTLEAEDEFLPLVACQERRDRTIIFLMTRKGKLSRFVFEELGKGDQQISEFHQFKFDEVTYPIILDDRHLYFLGKKNEQAILCGIYIKNMESFLRDTRITWLNNINPNQFPMHDGSRLIIKNAADGNMVVFASYANITGPVRLREELNPDNFFIIKQTLYSLSIEKQQIHRFVCKATAYDFAASLPLAMTINQRVTPIKNMIYVNGIIAVLTPEAVHLYRDAT